MELCGGTHVRSTGEIGLFKILSESGVAAGVRRIEAITGMRAVEWAQSQQLLLEEMLAALLNNEAQRAVLAALRTQFTQEQIDEMALRGLQAATRLPDENKRLARELQHARMKAALGAGAAGGLSDEVIDVVGVKLVAREVAGLDKDGLRALVDQHRSRIKSGVVILASPSDGKVTIVVGVTPDLTKRVPAGQVVKQIAPIVGGGGGGRPDFAEAGGKDPSKIGEMLAAARAIVEKMLST